MARYWLDTEFIEDGKTIDLISIGMVSEDGREYYAISTEFDESKANDWVKENVISRLEPRNQGGATFWKPRLHIKEDLLLFFAGGIVDSDEDQSLDWDEAVKDIEIWGEWCSYDWVVFCWLFDTMMDLPKGFPMRCRDIIQYAEDHLGIPSDRLPASLETEGNHHALLGAKTVKQRYLWLKDCEAKGEH